MPTGFSIIMGLPMGKRIQRILTLLRRAYGRPRPWRRSDPVDELVRTILSQNTSDTNSLGAFAGLRRSFSSWEELCKADTGRVARVIRRAGLARIKAPRIQDALKEIKRREGRISLASLRNAGVEDSAAYLR